MASLTEVISAYEKTLHELIELVEQPPNEEVSTCRIAALSVLVARDGIAQSLEDNKPLKPETLYHVYELDQQLKDSAMKIVRATGSFAFLEFRDTAHPADHAWWWWLDKRGPEEEQRRNPLWTILAALFIVIAIALMILIGQRFNNRAGNAKGMSLLIPTLINIVGFILSFIAGGFLTQTGQRWIGKQLSYIGIEHKLSPGQKAFWSGILMLIAIVISLLIPYIALSYQYEGLYYLQQDDLSRARESYEFALELNPSIPQAHYSLAVTDEDSGQYDDAMNKYKIAIKLDSKFYHAYNNLARLYILKQNDYKLALVLLDKGIELTPPEDRKVLYSFYKNRGWAHYGLNQLDSAKQDLTQAIDLARQLIPAKGGAGAHCLMAYVLEAQNESAYEEWHECLAYESEGDVEPSWRSDADQRISKFSKEEREKGKPGDNK